MSNKIQRIKELVAELNVYRDEYYNKNAPTISDEVYDRLFDELVSLEEETSCVMAGSPTMTVGYLVVSDLEKTTHNIPLLSLDKTKLIEDISKFCGAGPILLMLKLDGLTVKLTYENGKLIEAATRGDGDEGEIITHNAQFFSGVPVSIPYKERLVVVGEAFIYKKDFEVMQSTLLDSSGKPYRNARNLAAGSARLLDSSICKDRKISFIPFNVLEGFKYIYDADSKGTRLMELQKIGFSALAFRYMGEAYKEQLQIHIDTLQLYAEQNDIPIDGIVASFNSVSFSKSCGRTGHHYKDGMAFKFEDELFETTLNNIEWTPSRTGEISPVAVFQTTVIDGCEVSRASLHNLTFIRELELMPNCRILVSKRNMIIPHVEGNLDKGSFDADTMFPKSCPCCGEPTRIHISGADKLRTIETLYCDNDYCEMKKLRKFVHFVSKKAMDIDGLSEATLEKLIGRGWLHTFMDIYHLDDHKEEIVLMEGFGEKSYQRLWDAIQDSRNTTFERYLIAMDIPMIGNTASKVLSNAFESDLQRFKGFVDTGFDFTELSDFGDTLHGNIHSWFRDEDNMYLWEELQKMMNIKRKEEIIMTNTNNPFVGKTIVVTGKVEPYTRDGINSLIVSLGATAGSSVSKNTDYLVCGAKAGGKLAKAQSLGVTVLSPDEFAQMAGE